MRDIPIFTTEYGVASITLKEIPYKGEAYIRIQSALDAKALIQTCRDFCNAAGAEHIYITGHPSVETYPLHTSIVKMAANRSAICDTDAILIPVSTETISRWCALYNQKMMHIPNASYMSTNDASKILDRGGAYFIEKDDKCIGIGAIDSNTVEAIASISPGAGKDVLAALCSKISADTVCLEVATANKKAVQFYKWQGFMECSVISTWYIIK